MPQEETVGTDGTEIADLQLLRLTLRARTLDSPDNANSEIAVGITPMVVAATCTMQPMRPPRLAPRMRVLEPAATGQQKERVVKGNLNGSVSSAGRPSRSTRRAATVVVKMQAMLSRPSGKTSRREKEKVRAREVLSTEDRVTRKV